MLTTLVLTAVGQICYTQGNYRQAATTYAYSVPYAASYAAKTYNQVTTHYLPTDYYDYNYYGVVGEATRTRDRRIEALKAQADIALRLDKIAASLQGLNSLAANPPAIQAAPDVPAKPLPVPAKPSPQSPEPTVLPPTPKVNPDDGGVPPPPPVPNPGPTGAVGGFSAETVAVLTSRCQKCHSAAMAPKQGGEFALFAEDGSPRSNLSGVDMLRILQQVETGKMPRKANPLTPEERAFIRADVFGSKAVETALAQ